MSEYRKKAEECLSIAEKMRSPMERIEMLGIARHYMRLADRADKSRENAEAAEMVDSGTNLLWCCRYSTKASIKQPLQGAVEFAHLSALLVEVRHPTLRWFGRRESGDFQTDHWV
jgi:hypothetical protein